MENRKKWKEKSNEIAFKKKKKRKQIEEEFQNIWSGGTARIAIKKKVQETLERTYVYEQIP